MSKRRQSVIFFSAVLLTLVLITGLMRHYYHDSPPASFADLYLAAVLVLAYRCSWKVAAALAGVSLLLGAYLLLPLDRVDGFELASYGVCVTTVVGLSARLQRNHRATLTTEASCPNTTPESDRAPQS
jgi:hypothetical protein